METSNLPTHTKLDPQGRVVVPAQVRQQLQLRPGEALVLRVEGDRLILERPASVLNRLRSRFAEAGTASLADELIADRRREARLEATQEG